MNQSFNMRSRKSASREVTPLDDRDFESKKKKRENPSQTISPYVGIIFIFFVLVLLGLGVIIENQLPNPLKWSNEVDHPDRFIAERAQQDLKYLTDLGPRVVGSYENEVLSVEYLKKKINEIIKDADKSQHIELDVQVVSGSYYLPWKPIGQINVYANVQNVVVKLHGKEFNNSLLLNSHYDSVPTSPGGTDNGINCVTLLEVLRKFSRHKTRTLYNVIFLFNGAEEAGLLASHGFITKHKWAKESKVVINSDAAGAGGKIAMFQTGPNRPWLNMDYGKVPHPNAESLAEEMFQANLVPSDTDFRIFRDFGNIIGIDMAFTKDGYRYHTKYDGFKNIPLGSYQQVGDNMMSLVQNIANNPELVNPNAESGNVIYFTVCNMFISYKVSTASIMNFIVFAISWLTFLVSLRRFKLEITFNTLLYFSQILAVTIFGWLLAFLTVVGISLCLDFLGYAMSWYRHPWLVLGLFSIPTIITSTPMLLLVKPMHIPRNANSFIQAQMIRLIWTSIMLAITLSGIRTTYPLFVIVLFDTLAYVVILLFRLEQTAWLWKYIYLFISIIPTYFTMSVAVALIEFYIPLTGRMGNKKIPDLIVGLMTVFSTLLTSTPYYFLISLLRKPANFYKILVGIFAVCLVIVISPLGFPYSGNPGSPTPQRYWVLHSQRVFHGEDGGIIKQEAGYFFLNMDRNSPWSVLKYVDELQEIKSVRGDCNNFLFCGMPLAHPKMTSVVEHSSWIPASPPIIPDPVNIKVNSKTLSTSNIMRYNITVSGPDHLMFQVSPKKGLTLTGTNLLDQVFQEKVLWNGRPHYSFVYHCGKEVVPLTLILDLSVPENHKGTSMDIAVTGNYVHLRNITVTPDFQKFLSKFPDWVDMTAWVSDYQSWII